MKSPSSNIGLLTAAAALAGAGGTCLPAGLHFDPGTGDAPPRDPNRDAATGLLDRVTDMSTSLKSITEQLSSLKSAGFLDKDVDIKKVMQAYEQMRSQVSAIQESIRTRKDALYFPGVEDAGKKFNLLRLVSGIRRKDAKKYAPYEHEVVTQAQKMAEENGHIPQMRAGHTMWDDGAAGMWVPDQVIPEIIQPMYARSELIALEGEGNTRVSVIDGLTGNPVKIPEFEGGMIAYWIGEEDEYAESKTKSGNLTMSPKKLGILTRITEEMIQMASPGFNNFMRRDMVRAAARRLDWTILYGKGTPNMPLGVFNDPKVRKFYAESSATDGLTPPGSPTAGGVECGFDELMEMKGILEDEDTSVDANSECIVSCARYFRRLKKLKITNFSGQTSGMPYLLGAPFLSDDRLKGIIGNYAKMNQIPSKKSYGGTATATDILYGDLSEIVVGRWSGIQIVDDAGEGTGFIRDQTYIKFRMWADVVNRRTRALLHCVDAKVR